MIKFFIFIFLHLFIAINSQARILYFTEHTILTYNSTSPALEANIFIYNPSAYQQRICFPDVIMHAYSLKQEAPDTGNYWCKSGTKCISTAPTNVRIVGTNARILAKDTTCTIIDPLETLNLVFTISADPSSGVAGGLSSLRILDERIGNFTNWHTIPAASFGGGDFMGYVFLKGFFNVTDVNPAYPGFVTFSGNIIKPNTLGGFNILNTHEFNLNNGKPF
jgi:hypothetical protein